MSSFETSILINRPIEEVFAFVTDLDTWSEWQADLVEVKKTTPGPLAAGSTYTMVIMIRGRQQEVKYTVTEFEANSKITASSPGTFTLENQTIFIKVDQETRIRQLTKISSDGLYKIFGPLAVWRFKKQAESSYETLKELLEELPN
jgi:uncharacterized protein YndB with AHSA1/START domain